MKNRYSPSLATPIFLLLMFAFSTHQAAAQEDYFQYPAPAEVYEEQHIEVQLPHSFKFTALFKENPFDDEQCYNKDDLVGFQISDESGEYHVELIFPETEYLRYPFYSTLCHIDWPEVVDANFDGYPDFMIGYPMAGNAVTSPHEFWLYNPNTQLLEYGPDELQFIGDPVMDSKEKIISSWWRAGMGHHGVTLYRWSNDGSFIEEESYSSYFIPLKLNDEDIISCYTTPSYDLESHSVKYSLRVMQQADGTLSLEGYSKEDTSCHDGFSSPPSPQIDVWQIYENRKIVLVESFGSIWDDEQYAEEGCTEITFPYFDLKSQSIQWENEMICNSY